MRLTVLVLLLGLPGISFANWALGFDGENDYAIVASFAQEYSALTLEAWVYADPSGFYGEIVGCPTGAGDDVFYQFEGGVGFLLFDPATDACRFSAPCGLTSEEWHHVAAVYDPPLATIYLDGEPIGERSCTLGPFSINNCEFIVGKEVPEDNPYQFWDGMIDEVRVWNVARTQTEIAATMFMELTGDEPGLHGYWNFNEGSGQVAHDLTPSQQHLRLGSTDDIDPSDPTWVFLDAPVPVRQSSWAMLKSLYR